MLPFVNIVSSKSKIETKTKWAQSVSTLAFVNIVSSKSNIKTKSRSGLKVFPRPPFCASRLLAVSPPLWWIEILNQLPALSALWGLLKCLIVVALCCKTLFHPPHYLIFINSFTHQDKSCSSTTLIIVHRFVRVSFVCCHTEVLYPGVTWPQI